MNIRDRDIDGFLDLTYRAHGRLRYAKITKVGELLEHDREDLLDIPWLGLKTLKSIEDALAEHGLALKPWTSRGWRSPRA